MTTALVTGGTRGIGAAIAMALVDVGYEVIVGGTTPEGQPPERCRYVPCDFSDEEALEGFARELAGWPVAVLVNNAGINKAAPLAEYALDDFTRVQQVNVTAPFLLCRAVVPGMRQRRFGRIVNITSILSLVSRPGRSAYAASKCALMGLTRTLALEVAADNVLVNCVAPGFVQTDMTQRMLGPGGIAEVTRQIPVGRMARPEEIAGVVRFLVSEENTYLTGQNVVVDGGFTCG